MLRKSSPGLNTHTHTYINMNTLKNMNKHTHTFTYTKKDRYTGKYIYVHLSTMCCFPLNKYNVFKFKNILWKKISKKLNLKELTANLFLGCEGV
jgi:hypothetical protein